MIEYGDKYEHHLIISMSDTGIEEMQAYLNQKWSNCSNSDFFTCTAEESENALLHRFSAGGAVGNYQSIHNKSTGAILALDIALRRNDESWVDTLPDDISEKIACTLYYGHFLCNVFHRNYILKKGVDKTELKHKILSLLDKKGVKYPAEHNVGHLYKADHNLQEFYLKLDPTNTFNPGIGKMDKHKLNCNCCL
jgi:D-lactate dehydrogenase